jgi:hypothetical protein
MRLQPFRKAKLRYSYRVVLLVLPLLMKAPTIPQMFATNDADAGDKQA